MQPRYDIRVNRAYIIANNDIEWIASDVQHIKDIIQANPGSYKENPSLGVGIAKYLNSTGAEDDLRRATMLALRSDLYPCDNPLVEYDQSGQLTVNPNIEI